MKCCYQQNHRNIKSNIIAALRIKIFVLFPNCESIVNIIPIINIIATIILVFYFLKYQDNPYFIYCNIKNNC